MAWNARPPGGSSGKPTKLIKEKYPHNAGIFLWGIALRKLYLTTCPQTDRQATQLHHAGTLQATTTGSLAECLNSPA